MSTQKDVCDEVIVALRRVIRAVDLHSRKLVHSHGLTGPQATILRNLQNGEMAAGKLAAESSLSQGTVTDILNRLEQRNLITRERDEQDRRRVIVRLTSEGKALMEMSPPLLQEKFADSFRQLNDWEQTQLISSLQRIAWMMDAEDLDASPILSSGSITASEEAVEEVLEPQVSAKTQPRD